MKRLLLIGLILIFNNVNANEYFEPLSTQDIILESVFTVYSLIDWQQTKNFVKDGIIETNPIFEKHPQQETIDSFIGLGIISHWFFVYMIPKEYRVYFQVTFIRTELKAVKVNESNGYSISINF